MSKPDPCGSCPLAEALDGVGELTVGKITPHPGDVLVFQPAVKIVTQEQYEHVCARLRTILPSWVKFMVINPGASFTVIRESALRLVEAGNVAEDRG